MPVNKYVLCLAQEGSLAPLVIFDTRAYAEGELLRRQDIPEVLEALKLLHAHYTVIVCEYKSEPKGPAGM
jgi:hypothetical protein